MRKPQKSTTIELSTGDINIAVENLEKNSSEKQQTNKQGNDTTKKHGN